MSCTVLPCVVLFCLVLFYPILTVLQTKQPLNLVPKSHYGVWHRILAWMLCGSIN